MNTHAGGCLGNTDLEWVGYSLPWEEGEEIGHEFCVVRSRIFPEIWVADFAGVFGGKARGGALNELATAASIAWHPRGVQMVTSVIL
jgi:hypothetical protein